MAYVCEPCISKYPGLDANIRTSHQNTCVASCEICGPLRNDWEQKFLVWAPGIGRHFGLPAEQRPCEVMADLGWVAERNATRP